MKKLFTEVTEGKYDVIIIGGGASGLMAACTATKDKKRVLVLEKNNELGKKLKISGGGRCNITNAEYDLHLFLKNYGNDAKYLFSTFSQFGVSSTFSFFESRGLPLVVEARKRAFPSTQKAFDVFAVFEKELKKYQVEVKTNSSVKRILHNQSTITGVEVANTVYRADNFILATGGLSHPETGSTGDGFKWVKDLGHTVIKPTPSIVPLKVKEKYIHDLSGISLSFMKITFFVDGVKSFSKKGKVLFTHFGISGPLILNSSKQVADLLHTGDITAHIDMYPDTDIGSLDTSIRSIFDQHKNKSFKNVIKEIVPDGMHAALLGLFEKYISSDKKVHSITKEERRKLVDTLKSFPMTITGLMGFDRAVIADGGVPLSEIDTKTMKSKKINNLYITGDLLHINRPSGGYSLQLCWTTGYVAGQLQ